MLTESATTVLEKAEDLKVLHRDISFNNIMLTKEGSAVLNDWDHAGDLNRDPNEPHRVFRTVSINSLWLWEVY